jgi:hypothetical protein
MGKKGLFLGWIAPAALSLLTASAWAIAIEPGEPIPPPQLTQIQAEQEQGQEPWVTRYFLCTRGGAGVSVVAFAVGTCVALSGEVYALTSLGGAVETGTNGVIGVLWYRGPANRTLQGGWFQFETTLRWIASLQGTYFRSMRDEAFMVFVGAGVGSRIGVNAQALYFYRVF